MSAVLASLILTVFGGLSGATGDHYGCVDGTCIDGYTYSVQSLNV